MKKYRFDGKSSPVRKGTRPGRPPKYGPPGLEGITSMNGGDKMNIDELKVAKDKLAEGIAALIKDFEISTSVGVKNCHLDISSAIKITMETGETKTAVPSATSCIIDLNI